MEREGKFLAEFLAAHSLLLQTSKEKALDKGDYSENLQIVCLCPNKEMFF